MAAVVVCVCWVAKLSMTAKAFAVGAEVAYRDRFAALYHLYITPCMHVNSRAPVQLAYA